MAEGEKLNLDLIISRLLDVGMSRPSRIALLTENEIRSLCGKAREVFQGQPVLLEVESPIKICGNLHGQIYDLLRILEHGAFDVSTSSFLFLGDYVDFGRHSIETICLLMAYKVKYPDIFYLLRGHHETSNVNRIFGFYEECKKKYNAKMWRTLNEVFNYLPIAAVVEEKIFCVHGGLSPELQKLDQIKSIIRPTEDPQYGLLHDLLWSDPNKDILGWGGNDRETSYTFGQDVVNNFLQENDLELICRGHDVPFKGYEFFGKRQLVTICSAPNFRNNNAGAVMNVDSNLECSFQVMKNKSIGGTRMNYSINSSDRHGLCAVM